MLSMAVEAQARDAALGITSDTAAASSTQSASAKASRRLSEAQSLRSPPRRPSQAQAQLQSHLPQSPPRTKAQQQQQQPPLARSPSAPRTTMPTSPSQHLDNRLQSLPETTNLLSLEDRNQLLRRKAKLVKLLGEEVIEMQKEKIPSSPGTPTRKMNALQLRAYEGSPQSSIANRSPTARRRGASEHGESPLRRRTSANRLPRDMLSTVFTDENQDPRDSASIRRMRSDNFDTTGSPSRRGAGPIDNGDDDDDEFAAAYTKVTSFTPLPENITVKAAALLGLDGVQAQPNSAADVDRVILQARRAHRLPADHLSLAPSLQESETTSLRSKRSHESLHRDSGSPTAEMPAGRKRATSNASRHQRSVSLYSDCPTALADLLKEAEEDVEDFEGEGDEGTLARRTRRKRADKMSRWLGSVVPAHIVAPEAHNAHPAYHSDELPGSVKDFLLTSSSPSSSVHSSPSLGSTRQLLSTDGHHITESSGKQGGGSSFLPRQLRHHSSAVFERRSSPLARGIVGSEIARSDPLTRSDSSDLTAKEKYERVKRANKLEAMLGRGAGAAAMAAQEGEIVGMGASSAKHSHPLAQSGSTNTIVTSGRGVDVSDDSADVSLDSFGGVPAGKASLPSAVDPIAAAPRPTHPDSIKSLSTSSGSTFASPAAADVAGLDQTTDDAEALAAEEAHRRRVAQARKLNRFFGQSVPGQDVAVAVVHNERPI